MTSPVPTWASVFFSHLGSPEGQVGETTWEIRAGSGQIQLHITEKMLLENSPGQLQDACVSGVGVGACGKLPLGVRE